MFSRSKYGLISYAIQDQRISVKPVVSIPKVDRSTSELIVVPPVESYTENHAD
jgi:hypothetical protein